jgi:antirestriction protein ArdC
MRTDVYQKITDQIVQALESGVRPWHQPWNATHMEGRVALPLRHNGVAYRGVNVLALWMQAHRAVSGSRHRVMTAVRSARTAAVRHVERPMLPCPRIPLPVLPLADTIRVASSGGIAQ